MFINKVEIDKVKYYSEFDEMTGVYNRRAGFKRLSQVNTNKTSCTISICFVDINGLKEVNDSFGHDTGDELIKTVVLGIKDNIRNDDFITRLGGDEFLIVFSGIAKDEAEVIWDRIQKYYDEVNNKNDKKYVVSASHGIETFFCNSQEKIDDIINNADGRMYLEKKRIKKNLSVIKQ
ncbi:Diguanylate cyclase DosC [bioreactor metagenome]|uniref:Diguanylate cyclase DosC n=1 Tax=bioreactor metagenome TaxID=1076179 RepID=A0A645GR20_9ZZZZ